VIVWVGEFGRLSSLVLDCWIDVVSFRRVRMRRRKVRMSHG
jgi:hypothetical protein